MNATFIALMCVIWVVQMVQSVEIDSLRARIKKLEARYDQA